MKIKNYAKSILLVTFLILSGVMVLATPSFVTPSTAGSTAYGTYNFTVTCTLENTVNMTISTTADGIVVVEKNKTGEPNKKTYTNTTSTTGWTNAEDTTATALCSNYSGDTESTTLVINVDNGNPTCSFSVNIDQIDFMSATGVETTQASSDTTDLTYYWRLLDPNGDVKTTSTSASPNFANSDFDQVGDFVIGLSVLDEANHYKGCSATVNKTITVGESADSSAVTTQTTTTTTTQAQNNSKKGAIIFLVTLGFIVIIIGGFIAIFALKKK